MQETSGKRTGFSYPVREAITLIFTVVSVFSMVFLGLGIYERSLSRMETMTIQDREVLLEETALDLENYLRNMRRVSDALYYTVIKEMDFSTDSMDREMNLLYEANKDSLLSIACFSSRGELLSAVPLSLVKPNAAVSEQGWFKEAFFKTENLHFSMPHVQNLFENHSYRYDWVISLSREVDLTREGKTSMGVLLVDLDYASIGRIFSKLNSDTSKTYVYLVSREGEIIYHPRQNLINTKLFSENNLEEAALPDGSTTLSFLGEKRLITVKTVSYTGWKLISVVPLSAFRSGLLDLRLFVVLLMTLSIVAAAFINGIVSGLIASPLQRLEESVGGLEGGNLKPEDIYIGGSLETEHLGRTLRSAVSEIRRLMDEIVEEQEEKRKNELDALQSQINPHFLYNTLDSIVWMIEGEKNEEAVFMVTRLASLLRISLSGGKTMIPIANEITHAKNYMDIQKVRFKDRFRTEFDIDEAILSRITVKLVLQPLLENAINYGTEEYGDDGLILVKGYLQGEDVILEVIDEGMGMTEEMAKSILKDRKRVRTRGSGVGLSNVHERIHLRFGDPYGVTIESRPDEGTKVRIRMPAVEATEENLEALEKGRYAAKDQKS